MTALRSFTRARLRTRSTRASRCALVQCSRTATGSCRSADVSYIYFPDASGGFVANVPIAPAFTDAEIDGQWLRHCSTSAGALDSWRVNSSATVLGGDGTVSFVDTWYTADTCAPESTAMIVVRTGRYRLGNEMSDARPELARKRELDVS
jgi:hypothetical protein